MASIPISLDFHFVAKTVPAFLVLAGIVILLLSQLTVPLWQGDTTIAWVLILLGVGVYLLERRMGA